MRQRLCDRPDRDAIHVLFVLGTVFVCGVSSAFGAEQSDYNGIVRGKILRGGEAMSNIKVTLENETKQQYEPVLTDLSGIFILSGVKPGKYKVVVGPPGSQPNETEIVAAPDITDVPPIELKGAIDTPEAPFTLESSPPVDGSVTPSEARAFVKNFWLAREQGELDRLVEAFAPDANYYNHGVKDQAFIVNDQRNYLNHFTRRTFELGSIDILKLDKDEKRPTKFGNAIRVRFTFRYDLSGRKKASGTSSEVWIIQKHDNKLQIVDCKYKVLRD